ncbi:ABC-type Fe3+-hydroxamate transport system, periplasmic component [Corynebacterium kutscheri]|uniref:ABC-type Fe3+-hydroxamate transport system, periplasmic component n=1 Tax=Corynebacterium kutscheri TaxID=35755 RepID=A0A0F6R1G3_9CORY|nr:ABC transporter substrate-binding protein [Corynebacterium kutscheri]AKE41008.1 ABC-type Fe3+-hydroxamate transport system, periplasmic component [Corynebacterium kutscheri]VEH06898.1 putative iron transport system exported solute-binding component [Corynebacterium kutscheri]VEH09306.1 putative iron transport system exported solute-binding component [Corynebacterium kutscheri]
MKKEIIGLLAVGALVASCSSQTEESVVASEDTVSVTNCGVEVNYKVGGNWWVNDGNIISIALAAGARDNVKWVSSVEQDRDILAAKYGADVIDALNPDSDVYPSKEAIIAAQPDLMIAGWNYGFSESRDLTPAILAEQDIASYLLTESCRQEGSTARGTTDPWEAVYEDLVNLGTIHGDKTVAESVVSDMKERLAELEKAPQAEKAPNIFVFDSGTEAIFTSGAFGGPKAIIEAAGGKLATDDIEDTWVEVSWEKLATESPDAFVFVDYPGQSFADKVEVLKSHPATKDLPAVKEGRFINLSYAMWTSSALNIDAAEHVRKGLEKFGLQPTSDIKTQLELPKSLDGQEYFS